MLSNVFRILAYHNPVGLQVSSHEGAGDSFVKEAAMAKWYSSEVGGATGW